MHSLNQKPLQLSLTAAAAPATTTYRVSTNLIKQISRRFPGDSRRDFKKNPGHVCLASASYVMYRCSLLDTEQKYDIHFIHTTWGRIRDKIGRPLS